MITYIYALYDRPNRIRYVGKTTKPVTQRLLKHIQNAKAGEKTRKGNWLRQYIASGAQPRVGVLEVVGGTGDEEERKWIAHFRQNGSDLVNATDGGDGTPGLVFTPEHRDKISKALRGIRRSEETRERIRAARSRQPPPHVTPHTAETRLKIKKKLEDPAVRTLIGAANKGRKKSLREIDKNRRTNKRNWCNPEYRRRMLKYVGIKVRCIETGTAYASMTDAAIAVGGTCKLISRACKHGMAHRGAHWELHS